MGVVRRHEEHHANDIACNLRYSKAFNEQCERKAENALNEAGAAPLDAAPYKEQVTRFVETLAFIYGELGPLNYSRW